MRSTQMQSFPEPRSISPQFIAIQFQSAGPVPGRALRSPIVCALLFLGIMLLVGCDKKEAPPPPGPPDVLVAPVAEQNVPVFNDWVAQLNGPVNADITPKVQGYLLRQDYQN